MYLPNHTDGLPGEDLYFTLKYIAAAFCPPRHQVNTGMPDYLGLTYAEKHAQNEINELLRHELPEIRLLRERERMEARLFSSSSIF